MRMRACLLAVWGILIYQIKAIMVECLEISPAGHFKRCWVWRELPSPPLPPSIFSSFFVIIETHVLLKIKNRRDDAYWPEGKRVAMEDRYRPDFPRPDHRFHDFDHRDRGQYQDHVADRSAPSSLAAVDGATSARRRDGSLSSDISFTREAPRSWLACCTWDLQGHACSRMWDSGPLGHPQLISRSALFTDWWSLGAVLSLHSPGPHTLGLTAPRTLPATPPLRQAPWEAGFQGGYAQPLCTGRKLFRERAFAGRVARVHVPKPC